MVPIRLDHYLVLEVLMEFHRHANTTTSSKQRAYIQQPVLPAAELTKELGVSETTVRRRQARDDVQDCPHTPNRLATTLRPMDEFVVELRKRLLLPLDGRYPCCGAPDAAPPFAPARQAAASACTDRHQRP